jgi:segregation and condensation protein B
MVPPRLSLARQINDNAPQAGMAASDAGDDEAAHLHHPELAGLVALATADRREKLRLVEALLFASAEPVAESALAAHLPPGEDVAALLGELAELYAGRGVNLIRVAGKWAFRTADDLGYILDRHAVEERRLSKAALETLAIIAYHQPVTRAEIEEIRGVSTSAGTLDILLETGWVRPRGRRRAPGRPITYGTTDGFLNHFGLDRIGDLPGLAELKGAGLLDGNLPPDFTVPEPTDVAALMPDELPLEADEEEEREDVGEASGPPDLEDPEAP